MAVARSGGLAPAFRISAATGFSLPMELALVGLTLLILFVLVYPTAWIIIASFKSPAAIFSATMIEGIPSVTVIKRCTGRPCWSSSRMALGLARAGISNSPAWTGSLPPKMRAPTLNLAAEPIAPAFSSCAATPETLDPSSTMKLWLLAAGPEPNQPYRTTASGMPTPIASPMRSRRVKRIKQPS